ncbi:holin-associated N-acetylmuramidase [Yoonia sp.]|uniref:holin-associated N-acetylmuramidase n=1 Tax=Yoonia sp. TaxID=2212373 RepID=UPI0025DED436|nr:holin-associated N-acetylmuramidase [Yoonia sp.]
MQNITEIATAIVAREGGYVNDPDDPGGATKHGVTIHTMRRLGLDLTGDGQVTEADVRVLDKVQAVSIFVEHYFRRPKIDQLPVVLHASVFDMYVNAGAQAIKIMQRLLGDMRISVTVDGVIGPQTIAAATRAAEAAPEHLVDAYGIARRNYYYDLADRRANSRKYARRRDGGKGGWIVRAEEFIAPKYHLTDAQHQQRTARWD